MVTIEASRRERRKQENRDRIVAAGLRLFGRKGLDGCTIDDIAREADVGKGTIYNYFDTKEAIVVDFLTSLEREVQDEMLNFPVRHGRLDTLLVRFVHAQLTRKAPYHAFVRVFMADLCSRGSIHSPWVVAVQAAMDPPLYKLFEQLDARRRLQPGIDIATVVGAFKVMQLGVMVLWSMEGPPWTATHQALETQIRIFCRGIEVTS